MANVGQVLDHCYFCGIGFTKFEVSLPLIFTRKGCITNFWIILETVSGYLCRGTSFSASLCPRDIKMMFKFSLARSENRKVARFLTL